MAYLIFVNFCTQPQFWGVEILHLEVRKFATKFSSRQNSVHYHPRTQIMNCENYECMLNCHTNYKLFKIARWVKYYTMCKIANTVQNYTQSAFFHIPRGKFYTWLKTFTQPAVVMVVTNMRCAWWAEREGGWGGVEKRFVFNIKFWVAKATDIFRWSGSMFVKLNPERIISSFLLFENILKLGR